VDLKDFHDIVRFFLNKEQGGWFSPEELDSMIDRAQWWFYSDQYDVYSKTQKIQDSLSPFVTPFTFVSTSAGIVQLPIVETVKPCYEHLQSMYVQYFDNKRQIPRTNPIKIISEDELAERLESQILEPTISDPVAIQKGKGEFQIYPATTIAGKGSYFRRPVKPVFVYTESGRAIVYNQGLSTQLEWAGQSINKLIIKTLQLCGVNISDSMIISYTEQKDAKDM